MRLEDATSIATIGHSTSDCTKCCDLTTCPPPPPTCGPCPPRVWELEQCDEHDPFVCISGDAIGGCSRHSGFWPKSNACSECCDLITCPQEPTCEKKCSNEVCHKHDECSKHHPHACIEGGTDSDASQPIFGCNSDKDYWLENDLNCKDCCDTSLCD